MKNLKLIGYAGVTLILFGVIGIAAESHQTEESTSAVTAERLAFPDDGVTAAIDGALGRESTNATARVASQSGGIAQTAPQFAPAPASDATKPGATAKGSAEAGNQAASPGDPGVTAGGSASIDDRKIVQTASLNLQVKDVGGVFQEVGQIATAAGGFVAGSNFALQGEQQIATATIRVPASRYQDVLGQVRALGVKVEAETSNASDVTQEYSDLDARRRTLEATQTQLLQFLGQAKNIGETLQVQDRLNSIQTQIEQSRGRMLLLDKLSDLATLTVHLRPVVAPAKSSTSGVDLGAQIREAWNHSLTFLGSIAGGVLTVVVFAWWLPLLAIPAVLVFNGMRGRTSGPKPVQAYD